MLRKLLAFELRYHFRQVTFIIAALIFFLLGMAAVHGGFGSEVYKNGPFSISNVIGLLSLCSIFASTLLCANVVLRDTAYKMDAILFTSSVKRLPYFLTRLLGLLTAVFIILCCAAVGMAAGSFLVSPEELGPFNFIYFIQPLLVLGLPNILFSSAFIFGVGLLTQNARAVYAAGVLLYVLYWIGSIVGNSPLLANSSLSVDGPGTVALLSDPFGLSVFFFETRTWTAVQRNTQLFPLQGVFLFNRLLWSGIGLLILLLSYRLFRFQLKLPAASKKDKRSSRQVAPVPYRSIPVHPQGARYQWKAFRSQMKLEAVSLFRHIPFMVMLILWVFMYAIETRDSLFGGPYSIRSYPATSMILQELRSIKPAMLLIIFYAAELIWRERGANVQALVYSTPIRNFVPWAAKMVALGILIAVIITANIGIGIGLQLSSGYSQLELASYATLYYYSGLPLLLFAVLVVFIMSFTSNKYLGMLFCLLVAGLILFSPRIGIEHYLLRYASVPDMFNSSMNGFGHYAGAFNWYMLYWSGLAIVLSLISIALWQNNRQLSFIQRVKTAGREWQTAGKIIFVLGLFVWIGAGIWIYHQTNIIGKYKNRFAQKDWRLDYEKKYKGIADVYQPIIKDVKTIVDLFPDEQTYTVKGTYRLKNESTAPVTTLWLGTDPEVSSADFSIASAKEGLYDKEFNEWRYDLITPLLPGKETEIHFSLKAVRSGFVPFNNEHSVVENGSYIELEKYLPFLGYNDRYESGDKVARKKWGLPEEPIALSPDTIYHRVNYETTISTAAGQQVVTVGELQKEWKEGNRNYFHYKTTEPSAFMFALSSARYAIQKENYKGITLSILYQPGHTYNVPAIMQGMKDALDYGSAHFSPYLHKHLTLAELPQYRGAATAYPGVIFSAENINFLSDFSDTTKVNQAYAITTHETTHQWWGAMFEPAASPGNKLLTESLAKYTEAMIIEHRFGKMHLRNYLQADSRLYAIYRSMEDDEMPLDSAVGQPFVYYQKGGLAMYAIKESIGEEKITHALQNLLVKHNEPGFKANPVDLKKELCKDATPAQTALIDDQLSRMITWNLKLKLLECKPLPDGRFSVTVQATIEKNNGRYHSFKPVPVNDDIDIAVFEQQPELWNRATQPLYLQKHHFTGGETKLTIIVNKRPGAVGIDPYSYMLEENIQDNVLLIKHK
jgi:ABC-2 type transport system permease protein